MLCMLVKRMRWLGGVCTPRVVRGISVRIAQASAGLDWGWAAAAAAVARWGGRATTGAAVICCLQSVRPHAAANQQLYNDIRQAVEALRSQLLVPA